MASKPVTTVITPATSYNLVSLADLKADLSITTTTDDAFLTRAIGKASSMISGYCDRVLVVETVKDEFEYPSGNSLHLSRYPVVSVASVTANGVAVDASKYRIDVGGYLVLLEGQWSSPSVVTYSAGYNPIPLDLQAAAEETVKVLQFNRSRDPMLKSENILSGLYAYTLFDASGGSGTSAAVTAILDRYRRVSL